jgi:hypothetical protein
MGIDNQDVIAPGPKNLPAGYVLRVNCADSAPRNRTLRRADPSGDGHPDKEPHTQRPAEIRPTLRAPDRPTWSGPFLRTRVGQM